MHFAPPPFKRISAWNPERLFHLRGGATAPWDTVTTGNFMAFDAWLDQGENDVLEVRTNRGDLLVPLGTIDLEDMTHDAGGLERRLHVLRLPEENGHRDVAFERSVALDRAEDNSIWDRRHHRGRLSGLDYPVFLFH